MDTLSLVIAGRAVNIRVAEGLQPTSFSLFAANMFAANMASSVGVTADLAIDAGAGGGVLSIVSALSGISRVIAIERSPRGCELIAKNARNNGVANRIEIVCGDIGSFQLAERADIVVSNPPTVPERSESPGFIAGSGADGMAFVRTLFDASSNWLRVGGELYVVISSLVDEDGFKGICEQNGFQAKALSTTMIPVRDFYYDSYSRAEIDAHVAAGRLISESSSGRKILNELVYFYRCTFIGGTD